MCHVWLIGVGGLPLSEEIWRRKDAKGRQKGKEREEGWRNVMRMLNENNNKDNT